jgi:hypothetical protein
MTSYEKSFSKSRENYKQGLKILFDIMVIITKL